MILLPLSLSVTMIFLFVFTADEVIQHSVPRPTVPRPQVITFSSILYDIYIFVYLQNEAVENILRLKISSAD